ncbi:hypothetical protein PILCRDRAFT_16915 [Piloderma croceum F 1598]|uniref:Uncharacterized protein n=1 Tax=Piloderma croceum (strain F 1598) TaxID=765440 RepID=A0A0C3B2Z4_PILCF|nr:hypothetical protein PILCRDRAFT_16915 [Piloderma croceum F 1598]
MRIKFYTAYNSDVSITTKPATSRVSTKTCSRKGRSLGNSPDVNSSSGNERSSQNILNGEHMAAQKKLLERARKAKNQRKYYETHKAAQQEKAHERAARNRFLAKQQLWMPTIDDGYDIPDNDYTPSLVPVFDPAFVSIATVNHAVVSSNAPPPFDPAFVSVATVNHAVVPSNAPPPSDAAIDMAQQATLTTPFTTHDDMAPHKRFTFSPVLLPETVRHGEFLDFVDWESWPAPRRIAAVRHWIMHAVHKYGPVECWAEDFGEQWREMGGGDASAVQDGMKQRIRMGQSALSYLETAMEGNSSTSAEEWRDLYAQSHQLACQLWTAVVGVQYKLDSIIVGEKFAQTQLKIFKCM